MVNPAQRESIRVLRERAEAEEERARRADPDIDHIDDPNPVDQMEPIDIDAHMEQMIEDLYHRPAVTRGTQSRSTHDFVHDESLGGGSNADELDVAARESLYSGASFSVLRASLEILNLQTAYGWSNTSVDSLYRYQYNII